VSGLKIRKRRYNPREFSGRTKHRELKDDDGSVDDGNFDDECDDAE
jgi:hypothetical protein